VNPRDAYNVLLSMVYFRTSKLLLSQACAINAVAPYSTFTLPK